MLRFNVKFIVYSYLAILHLAYITVYATEGAYLTGFVYDKYSNPLNAVTVELDGQTFITKDDGFYFFEYITKGSHEIKVSRKWDSAKHNISVKDGSYYNQTLTLDIKLLGSLNFRKEFNSSDKVHEVVMLSHTGLNSQASENPVARNQETNARILAVKVFDRETKFFDIWLISETDGEVIDKFITRPGSDESPKWSGLGDKIVYQSHEKDEPYKIFTQDLSPSLFDQYNISKPRTSSNSSRYLEFIDVGITPSFSSNSRFIVYAKKVDDNWDIFKFDLLTTEITQLTVTAENEKYPHWCMVNGKEKILFSSDQTDIYEIWIMDTDGSNAKRLSNAGKETNENMYGPILSPDGMNIAFWSVNDDNQNSVWLMSSNGDNQQKILDKAANPSWRTDSYETNWVFNLTKSFYGSNVLYFDSDITGRNQIWAARIVF